MISISSRIQISRVQSHLELQEVDRLRQEVFLEEMGYCPESIRREQGILSVANRQGALFIARYGGEPAATIAVDWWRDLSVEHPDVQNFQMKPFADAFGSRSLLTVRKWLVKPDYRSTRVGLSLIHAVASFTARYKDVHFVIIDCDPKRVRSFGVLGFRRYGHPFRYEADQAWSIPMCVVASDLEYLKRIRSPTYKLLVKDGQEHRPDVAAFFDTIRWRPDTVRYDDEPRYERLG